jgi:signal transduction histidine kinase
MDKSVPRDQKQRLEMIVTSTINYLFGCAGLLMYGLAGSVPWHISLSYFVVTMAGNAVFVAMVKTNRNLRLADPNMFVHQQVFSGTVVLVFLLAAPEIAFIFLATLFITGVFGLVQFDVQQLKLAWLATAAGSGAVFVAVGDRLALPASTPLEVLLLWVILLLALGRFTVVGARVGFLRQRLRERNEQLQQSLDRIESLMSSRAREEQELAIAQERQRILREMHDGIGANLLTSLAMLEHGRLAQADLVLLLRECIDDLMLTVDSLELLENDMVEVLATLRYRLEKRLLAAGIQMEWQVTELPPLPWLEANQALSVMRLLQEALANIVKHAQARTVCVATRKSPCDGRPGVEVVITDDGVGFAAHPAAGGGHGLRNMRERAAGLGGRVDIASAPGATSVVLWLPLGQGATPVLSA